MSWSDALVRLPIVVTRKALGYSQQKAEDQQREIVELRGDLRRLRARVDLEKAKRHALERRGALRKARRHRHSEASAYDHLFAGRTDARYAFASVVSYPKSGRTWFSTLYFHYARLYFNETELRQKSLYTPDKSRSFQQMLAQRAAGCAFPVCRFTHLGSSVLKPFEQRPGPWPDRTATVLAHPTVLIVRDPRDVVVSHYHHLRALGGALEPDVTLTEFIRGPWGIRRVLRFLNMWAEHARSGDRRLTICTYEKLRKDAGSAFAEVMTFLGAPLNDDALARAVEASSFDQLQDQERGSRFARRLSLEPDSFRFRKGIVGAHTEELAESDRDYLAQIVSRHLDPVFLPYVGAAL